MWIKQNSIGVSMLLACSLLLKSTHYTQSVCEYYFDGKKPFELRGDLTSVEVSFIAGYFVLVDILPKCIMLKLLEDLDRFKLQITPEASISEEGETSFLN
mmetsp:Transcript_112/g.134  ORF Transcript_112/g.134 Transcript_112/m.134 type:complete len:100 (+) Transcript_112:545-844(+)